MSSSRMYPRSLFEDDFVSLPDPEDWDEFGSTLRINAVPTPPPPRSLLKLKSSVLPAVMPSGLHYYYDAQGNFCSSAYAVGSYACMDMADVDELMEVGPNTIVYLHAVWLNPSSLGVSNLVLRAAFIDMDKVERSALKPMPVKELLEEMKKSAKVPLEKGRYPHKCPNCKLPAFIGFNLIDCSARCR